MYNKPFDKTNKANIKCEHCANWVKSNPKVFQYNEKCRVSGKPRSYYQKCDSFKWEDEE